MYSRIYLQMSLWGYCPDIQHAITIPGPANARVRSDKRIGPHDGSAGICILFGAILSDAQAERHGNGNGASGTGGPTRIALQQESHNFEFLRWFNDFLARRGYTSEGLYVQTRRGTGDLIRTYAKSVTYTYTSFNWIHDCFYVNGIKIVPHNFELFITGPSGTGDSAPLTQAVWIMGTVLKYTFGKPRCLLLSILSNLTWLTLCFINRVSYPYVIIVIYQYSARCIVLTVNDRIIHIKTVS